MYNILLIIGIIIAIIVVFRFIFVYFVWNWMIERIYAKEFDKIKHDHLKEMEKEV